MRLRDIRPGMRVCAPKLWAREHGVVTNVWLDYVDVRWRAPDGTWGASYNYKARQLERLIP